MASMVRENLGGINCQLDGFDELIETSKIDNSLVLTSLLDEFQMEEEEEEGIECDAERLMSVIQSLQAEIDPFLLEGHDSSDESEWDDENWTTSTTSRLISNGHVHRSDEQDCSTMFSDDIDHHFNWMEMDDVSALYMECHGEGIGHLQLGISDCSQMFEEQGYASLWQ